MIPTELSLVDSLALAGTILAVAAVLLLVLLVLMKEN